MDFENLLIIAPVDAVSTETSIAPLGACPALSASQKTSIAVMRENPTYFKAYLVKLAAIIRTY